MNTSTEKVALTESFSSRLKRWRLHRGLTQKEAAEKLRVVVGWYNQVENGRREPGELFLAKFDLIQREPIHPLKAHEHSVNSPVRQARERAGMTIRQLAKAAKPYGIGVLQAVEEGRSQISHGMAAALKRALPELDLETLLRNDENPPTIGVEVATMGSKPDILTEPGIKVRYVPLISWAQAGNLTEFADQYEFEGHIAFDSKDPKAFAIGIRGDSMEPQFAQGDVAIVYPSREASNGNLVIGKTRDGEVFFKRLTVLKPGEYRFTSYNPVYGPFDRARADLEWLYPVASVHKHTL